VNRAQCWEIGAVWCGVVWCGVVCLFVRSLARRFCAAQRLLELPHSGVGLLSPLLVLLQRSGQIRTLLLPPLVLLFQGLQL